MHLSTYVFILFIIINNKYNTGTTGAICLKYLEEKYNNATEELRKV